MILGQDPYPGGHADGLAFSSGISDIPYSLEQIFRDMERNGMKRTNPKLDDWAQQGVLLLNSSLTTLSGQTNAHKDLGWYRIIDAALEALAVTMRPQVWIAWGSFAQSRIENVLRGHSHAINVLKGNHPAAVRHGYIFKGGEHMLQANEILQAHNIKPIKWSD